jgi:hypothetical protein
MIWLAGVAGRALLVFERAVPARAALRRPAVSKSKVTKQKEVTMKYLSVFGLAALTAASLFGADSSPSDTVTSAAAKLGKDSYSWKSTTEFGNFTGTAEGKIAKDGLTSLSMSFGDNTTEAFLKGDKGAVKAGDQDWQSLAELTKSAGGEPGPQRFLVRRLQSFKAPAAEAADLAGKTKDLKESDDVYSGDLTEAGAKQLMTMGGRRGANAPEPKNAKGSVKFWVKDGVLSKYELHLAGTVNFNGEDRDVDRTTTVEIKDVGTTKVEVPEAAGKKLTADSAEAK